MRLAFCAWLAVRVCGVVDIISNGVCEMAIFDESDKETIIELLQSGMPAREVAFKWDCDPTQLYRKLRLWGLNTKGEKVTSLESPGRSITKRNRVLNYISAHNYETTVLETARATKVSQELVREVISENEISLKQKCRIDAIVMKRNVLLVNEYKKDGLKTKEAIEIVGITQKQYYHWNSKIKNWKVAV